MGVTGAVVATSHAGAGSTDTAAGDQQPDLVIVDGTTGDDRVTVSGTAGAATVGGLSASVTIDVAEGALDTLRINGLAGTDTLDGGPGNNLELP